MTHTPSYIASISELEAKINKLDKTWTNIYILVDENTKVNCLPILMKTVPFLAVANLLVLDPGEEYKTLEICESLWTSMLDTGADRKSLLINLGGGVITDMGGFVASTFKRGIDFIHIPTTLLGQVDAAIGGKTGINIESSKNQVGTFSEPLFTFVDSQFLRTLPQREFISGLGEVIKYGLIADKALFELIKDTGNLLGNIDSIIQTCVELKQYFVEVDFKESGERKKLNFGHTIGHAIESYFMGEVLHGEAIAAGMICESYISFRMNFISKKTMKEIVETIGLYFDHIELEEKMLGTIMEEIRLDKKNVNGKLNFTLLEGIGNSRVDEFAEDFLVMESLNFYLNNI